MAALRASWQVFAGLIPGTPMAEATKTWLYTSEHFYDDGMQRGPVYQRAASEAHDYARQLEAGGYNWVKVEYIWL